MQKGQEFKPFLNKAKALEKRYDWLGAVTFYEKAFGSVLKLKDFLKAAELREQIGFCFYRAAFQAETNKQFRSRMKQALSAHEQAVELYQKVEEEGKWVKINHAKAMTACTNSWLEKNPSKKKELSDEWWRLEKEVLKEYEEAGDRLAIGKVCTELSEGCLLDRFMLESKWLELARRVEEGFSYGEKAIVALSEVGDDYELARAYSWTCFYYAIAVWYRVLEDKREEFGQKWLSYSKKALALSEKTGDAWLIGHSNLHAGFGAWAYEVNPFSALKFFEDAQKHGAVAKDNLVMGIASTWIGFNNNNIMNLEEDPDKQREGFKKSLKCIQDAIRHLSVVADYSPVPLAYSAYVDTVTWLASIETNLEAKRVLFEKAVEVGREGLEHTERWVHLTPSYMLLTSLSAALHRLSETETKVSAKRRLLEEASKYREKYINILQRLTPFDYWIRGIAQNLRALIQAELAKTETDPEKKTELLKDAVSSMEKGLELFVKDVAALQPGWKIHYVGSFYYRFGGILEQLSSLTKDKKILGRAIEVYKGAIETYSKAELMTHMAESHWQIAKLYDKLGEHNEAARNYALASEEYKLAAEKIPQLKEFYEDYSLYMQAWSEIERAWHNHETEEYDQSRIHYEKAANLHRLSKPWSYLAPNYSAWAQMEKAEALSREESTQEAIHAFQQTFEYFKKAQESIQTNIKEITVADEKEMAAKLIKASDLRRRYCQARINIEEAKILDRKGDYNLSSKSYGSAAEKLKGIIGEVESDQDRRELKLIMVLCQAWQKMALAEEKASPEIYQEASKLFEQAKEESLTKRDRLLASGSSSFCKALAAGTEFEATRDVAMHSKATKYIEGAATFYLKAGFRSASEYAKATQRLFDAYVYMSNAGKEIDPDKKAKYYLMAEKVLHISAGLFIRAKQPEKNAEVQRILETVKEERELAVSLNEVLHAPAIATSTASFITPTPTNEDAVGLERFEHADIQANLIASVHEVRVGENVSLEVEFVNAGKEPALLTRVEGVIPEGFSFVEKPDIYRVDDGYLNMKGKRLPPLKIEEVKLVLQPLSKGVYPLNPKVFYLDEAGNPRSCELEPLTIKVEEVILPDRISTGLKELDSLLLGGIPERYAVVLTASSSDERDSVIKSFLETGVREGQITFHVTGEATDLESLAESFQSNFFLFLCNIKAHSRFPALPNVHKLLGTTNLTNLNIALTKAYRTLDKSLKGSRRACIEIVSDVLLLHKAVVTRRWLSEAISDLRSKGFTTMTVMNPLMHPPDQVHAILGLFDGEISIDDVETRRGIEKLLRIKKLRNKRYVENPIPLKRKQV